MSDRSDDTGPEPETSEADGAEPHWPDPPGETAPLVEPDATRVLPAADAPHPDPDRPNGTGPFLTAHGLTAAGRQGPIFTDVTLAAGLGQVVALCGDGGDGRSSLLLALAGRFAYDTGTLTVDGQTKPGQIRRRFTVAQAGPPVRFDPYHTVAACIKETTTVSAGAATRANIHAWLDRLAVDVDSGDTYGFLPRIEQIRFAIACAAACRTPGIVVDDTDTGLDHCGSERVFEALRTVADAGQLVIAACTRSSPPADHVIDLRDADHGRPHRREDTRNGGHQ
ncbi:ATP-binding cassette domain-containing protein [Glycomyces sp. NPDC046736]|uniref:ATP-binding cassette domain-containing protein n=1 Tax=Glycomyces sp. NPDC046736 TaxID=3155615 RepID=UPI0033D46F45